MSTLPTVSQNGVLIVYVRDVRLIDESRIEGLGAELNSMLNSAKEDKMLMNFRNVKFMGSAMIGKIIQLSKKCKESGMDLRFCDMNENLLEVFELMKLTKVLSIYPTEESALEAFKKNKKGLLG